jgi:arylsulfatase A-like enzyme
VHARPNVILVLLDTLRADHLSCYGYERRTTPCIDRIADGGVLYEYAISPAAWTPPAHASLFTGTYPSRHRVDRSSLALSPQLIPLPEALGQSGYRTFGVSSNYWLSRETRFDRGFDHFVHSWQLVQTRGANAPLKRQHRKHALGLEGLNGGGQTGRVRHALGHQANALYERVTQTLRRSFHAYDDGAWRVNHQVKRWLPAWTRGDQPFFAFLHYMEPHIRYAAPGRYHDMHLPRGVTPERARRVNQDPWKYLTGKAQMDEEDFAILRGLYDGEISYVDFRVGQLYDLVRDAGLLGNTVFIITSDHGENLGEHGLMDHAYCLYDTLLHVPLIVRGPEEFPAGERVPQQVQSLDLFSTILRLAGVRDEKVWGQVQARESLLPADVRGGGRRFAMAEYLEPQPPVAVLAERFAGFDGRRYDRQLRAVRTPDAKYVWASDGQDELYRLAVDPREERNVVSSAGEDVVRLRATLNDWLGAFEPVTASEDAVELDPATRKRLEDLGYLSA